MKYVVDANIIFSALYDMSSNAGELLVLAIEKEVELFSTEHVRKELQEILVEKLDYSPSGVDTVMKSLPVEWLERGIYEDNMQDALEILTDEADASLLACGAVMRCDVITGDKKVLSSRFKNVKVSGLRDAV